MYGHNPQRTGWAFEENILSPINASKMTLLWKAKPNNQYYSLYALTPPVVAMNITTVKGLRNVTYVVGITGTVFALDADTGEEIWNYAIKTRALPGVGQYQGGFLCPNGITAAPVIDKSTNTLYVIASNGALYGLDLGGGRVRYGPVQFVHAFSKSTALNLVDGVIYTTLAQGCGGAVSGVYAIDVKDRHRPSINQMLLSNTDTAGIWGRSGAVIGQNGKIYGGTADGKFDPIAGDYSNTVIGVTMKDLALVDYFLPPNWQVIQRRDFDLGASSPVWFGWKNRNLLAGGFKEGLLYLMDADDLGGKDHQTPLFTSPRYGNDKQNCCEGQGIWGGLSSFRDETGQTWVYAPMGGPVAAAAPKFPITNGDAPNGSVMAFKVVAGEGGNPVLEPAWMSGDFNIPDPVVIANGVVFGLSTGENPNQRGGETRRMTNVRSAVLKAMDAKTGKELFNSGDSITGWVHFSGMAVANGKIYVVDHDSNVYCFGVAGTVAAAKP